MEQSTCDASCISIIVVVVVMITDENDDDDDDDDDNDDRFIIVTYGTVTTTSCYCASRRRSSAGVLQQLMLSSMMRLTLRDHYGRSMTLISLASLSSPSQTYWPSSVCSSFSRSHKLSDHYRYAYAICANRQRSNFLQNRLLYFLPTVKRRGI